MLPASSRLLKTPPRLFVPDLAPFIQSAPSLVCRVHALSRRTLGCDSNHSGIQRQRYSLQ